jgi:hypothetical protein
MSAGRGTSGIACAGARGPATVPAPAVRGACRRRCASGAAPRERAEVS